MAVGGFLCFKGNVSARMVLAKWGALVGFVLGGSIANATPGDSFLQSGESWLVGALFGFVVGMLAYMFYEVAMVVLLASAGFFLAAAIIIIFGLDWSWLTVLIVSLVGVAAGLYSFVYKLPKSLVVGAATLSGAAVFTVGMMLTLGVTKLNEVGTGVDVQRLRDSWAWLVLLGVVGIYAAYLQWQGSSSFGDRKQWPPALGRK